MNNNLIFKLLILIIPIGLILPTLAGTTGKISGIVKDAETNEPLPGCNIIIEGTTLGAASDINGEFFILNIPPGIYTVRASMVGYKPYRIDNVRILIDLTTSLEFIMQVQVLDIAEEIVVTAERPLIQKDVTSKQSIISSDEILNMPVNSIQDILTTKAGFTTDSDGQIHVRGGRVGEIGYLIDGVKVDDPLYGRFSNTLNKDAINEMEIISGTFNAEYGDAMSSIVNLVTKDGGSTFHGKVEYTSPMINESPYRKANPFPEVTDEGEYVSKNMYDQQIIPIPGMFNLSLNGPVFSKLTFLLSGVYRNEDSYLPHGYNVEGDGLAKLTYTFSPTIKLALSGQLTGREYQGYSHPWKYFSDHQTHTEIRSNRLGLIFTHTLSNSFFYVANFSRFENNQLVQVDNKQPEDYEMGRTGETVYFFVSGDDSEYADNTTVTYRAKGDATFQANINHQFKSGFELVEHNLKVYEESEPWPSGAQFKDEYTKNPIELAAYIQDKIEFNYIIINIGLRYDYADPKSTMWPNIYRFGYFDENNNWVLADEVPVEPKTQLSPRIGLAHPITEDAVLHFSYGHFFQNPDYNSLYYNLQKDLSTSLPLIGNPDVKAQKTVSYEAGIKYKLSESWALDLTAWYKDITDLLSTLQISYLSQDYVVFYNSDYASVKGIDLTLYKRYSNYFSGSLDYSYMVAKGNNSQPLGGYFDAFAGEEIPHQEYFLDFDQRHKIALNLNFNIPENSGLDILGLDILSNFNLNVIVKVNSGLPYTPYVDPTVRIDVNSARKPWTSTIDLRAIKTIPFGGVSAAIFLEITNLLNTENVVFVYSRTGKPFDTGESGLVGSSPDADHNPAHLGPPRIIKLGAQIIL
ncbi:MAG: TonB-dependent receptor [Ignavibacteriaceae bacterium]|jgi:outer membrane receptor protein involved in Fe transport|nr:TonB-dependent receptor [Ignavibacteriaceae bacterium]